MLCEDGFPFSIFVPPVGLWTVTRREPLCRAKNREVGNMTDVFVITTRSGWLPYRGYKGRAAGTFRAGQQLITASILPQGKVPHKTEYQENTSGVCEHSHMKFVALSCCILCSRSKELTLCLNQPEQLCNFRSVVNWMNLCFCASVCHWVSFNWSTLDLPAHPKDSVIAQNCSDISFAKKDRSLLSCNDPCCFVF